MASENHKLRQNLQKGGTKSAFVRLSDTPDSTDAGVEILTGTGVPSGAYGRSATAMLYIRDNPANANEVLYVTHDGGTTWTAK